MSDPRTEQGLRKIQVWVTPELASKLDAARDLIPMQRYLVRMIEQYLAALDDTLDESKVASRG